MSIKAYKTAVCASALMAVVAWSGGASAVVATDFESTLDSQFSGGTLGAGGPTSAVAGYPGNFGTHAQVLAITGTVEYTEGTSANTGASQVDFMFKAEPTDELELITDNTVKVALAVGPAAEGVASVPVSLWCKADGDSTNSWVTLCSLENGAWARATLVLDYSNNRCRVSINGDPQITAAAVEDAWYAFVNSNSANCLNKVTMVGSTEVDDFVVSHDALAGYSEPFSGTVNVASTGQTITYDQLNEYGITVAQAEANADVSDGAGMTISQKLTAGLNPKSATKFEMQTMTATSSSAATITFPGNKGASGYTVTVTADAAGTGTVLDTATVTPGAANADGETINSAVFSNLPADRDLIYFHLKAN